MKKIYSTPTMETYRIQTKATLLDASVLNPEDYIGGGGAGSRLFENEEMDILMGENLENLLY